MINTFQKSCRKWGKETSSRTLFVFSKSFKWRKKQGLSTLVPIYFGRSRLECTIKTNYEISDSWSIDILNINFSKKKGFGTSFSVTIYFSQKIFPMLHSRLPQIRLHWRSNLCTLPWPWTNTVLRFYFQKQPFRTILENRPRVF